MPPRIEGPDPPKPVWTRRRVWLSMVGGWREGRRPAFMGAHSTARSALDWALMYLPSTDPQASRARTYLLTAVMLEADGGSFREMCRERGWKRSTALRAIEWALGHIIDGLNEADRMQNNC